LRIQEISIQEPGLPACKGRVFAYAERNAGIASMLAAGASWSSIQAATGCSRATVAKIAKRQAKRAA
jgi:DNA invertase Pin-like site-specific DNA recombinase